LVYSTQLILILERFPPDVTRFVAKGIP